jgi:hypothetical protein
MPEEGEVVILTDVTLVAFNGSEFSNYSNKKKHFRSDFITDRITIFSQTEISSMLTKRT